MSRGFCIDFDEAVMVKLVVVMYNVDRATC